MNLQCNNATARDFRFTFRVIDGLHIVDPQLNSRAFAADPVVIPFFGSDDFVALIGRWPRQNSIAATFIVQAAPPTRAHIRLVPDDFVMVRDLGGSNLHTRIGIFANQLELQSQLEIAKLFFAAEKFVVG